MPSKSIPASQFKSKCLQMLDEVSKTGQPVVITKNGRPIAQLAPVDRPETLIGAHKGKIAVVGDILSPVEDDWEAGR